MGPRSSKTREDHFFFFSDLKFTSVKISNNALNFLLAQYRAIFKRAYIKGIASAVILTAGLAAGQSQAASTQDPFWINRADDTNWEQVTSGGGNYSSAARIAGDYDNGVTNGTPEEKNDGIVSGAGLVIGNTASGGDFDTISSGSAYGGYVSIASGNGTDAVAENNKLTVTTGGDITSTQAGNLVGGWAKTKGTGKATATGNTLQIGGITTLSSGGQFIGGMAGAYHGAVAEENKLIINGIDSDNKLTLHNSAGNIGGIVYVGDGTSAGSGGVSGEYRAEGNLISGSNFTVDSNDRTKNQFVGGTVTVLGLESNHTIETLSAVGNSVELSDFSIGSTSNQSGGHIVANKVVYGSAGINSTVENFAANGTSDSGITLKNGTLHASQVYGGWAENHSGGYASANANTITIIDTNLQSGGSSALNNVVGGLAQTKFTGTQKVNLTASQNTVSFENTKYSDNNKVSNVVLGDIRGALVTLSGTSSPDNAADSTLTLNNNTVTIGEHIDVSNGSIHGAYVEVKDVTSGGATVHASYNTVTVKGNFTASKAAHTIMGVRTESGLVTAENNKLVINGKVTGDAGTLIHAVNVAEQQPISAIDDLKTITHYLRNNSVEIDATAEISNASIAAAVSNSNNAITLNNDVTVAGKVTNSDIYGGTGADSLVDVQAGSRLTYSESTDTPHHIISDNVDLGGVISVGQHDTLSIKGYANDGNIKSSGTKYNTNLTNIKSTAELYNRGTVELFGDTTVAEGAKLHALADGATITVTGDKGGDTINDAVATTDLKQAMVGGRGQLTISKAQLQSYLTAGNDYTLDSNSGTDKAGTVEVTSGGVLEFTDSNIDLATLDYSTSDEAGKIKVDATGGSTILKGDAVTISHALAGNGTKFADGTYTLNKDGKFGDDYSKLDKLTGAAVSIEANDLILGSSLISDTQSAEIKFEKATAKDSINFTVGSGTFTLTSKVAGNNYMHTNNLDSDLEYFTALNGTITGDVDVVSGGELTIEYGHWTAQDAIELKADTTAGQGGALNVGIANTDTDARNYIVQGNAKALPDATLVLDHALTVNLSGAGTATVKVDGQHSGAYQYGDNDDENRLGVYDEQLAQSTVGDDHYVMLDLRNGLDVIGDAKADGQLKGKFELTAQSGGVVKMMADDLNALLVQNNAEDTDSKSGSFITVSDKAHLQVTGDVDATFRDFGQVSGDNGIKLDDGVMSANSLSLIHVNDSTLAQEDATYIASGANKIDFGSSGGTVSVQEVVINDFQSVTKPNSTSDNDYASQVIFAQGTLDIGENLSSINDTLVVGVADGSATQATLNFYGADIVEGDSGATGTINVDTIQVANGFVKVENGAWEGNAFDLGASGDMVIGGSEDDRANLTAQSLKMTQGSLLDVLATGNMTVNSVDFSGLTAAATFADGVSAVDTGVQVAGTLTINGTSGDKGGVLFGDEGSIDIAKNGVLKFGSAATTGAILANSTYNGAASIQLVNGYTKIANNGGAMHLALSESTVFDGEAIKQLKRELFTSGSFENPGSSTQLKDGGVLNIGDASFKGITGFEQLTAPGTSGYTIAWDNVREFSDVFGNDVTNNQLSQANINSIQQGADKIQGHWGSLSMESGVAAGAQVTIAGDTTLYNAAGNNGFFVSDASHQEAKGAIVEAQKDLELLGGGTIGRVSLEDGSNDAYKNLTILEVRDGATTIAAIDAKDAASIAKNTVVNLYSDTTVTGDITNIGVVEAYQGAQVKAANAKVNEVSTQNADIAIAGDLTFQEAFVFGGSLSAKNADMDALGGKEMAVINGGRFDAETFKGTDGATIRVGLDTSSLPANVSLEDITLDDGTVAGGTGYFEVDTLELNHATLVVDPEYTEATSVAAALKFKKGKVTNSTNDVGTMVGRVHVGKNAAFGVGATLAETQAAIAEYQVGGALDQEKYGSILYLNGQLTVDNGSEIALNAHDNDIRQSLLYTISQLEENQFADLGLGKNTAIIMTQKAFEDGEGNKTGTAIHFDRQDAVVNGAGGEIVLAGDFDLSDQLTIFSDNGNATDATKTGVNVIGSIEVRTANGFLFDTLSGEDEGKVNLKVDTDRAYQVMSQASNPVVETLIAYAPSSSSSQGGATTPDNGTEGSSKTVPATPIAEQNTLAQNSGRSGAIIELPGETTPETPSEPSEPSTPGEGGEPSNPGAGEQPSEPTAPAASNKSAFLNAVVINTHGAPAEQAARLGVYGGTAQVGLAAAGSNSDVLESRFGIGANAQSLNLASNGMGGTLWVAPIYKSSDSDDFGAQGLNYGVDFDLYGVALGGDYKVTNEVTVGAMFNVGSGSLDGQGNAAAAGTSNDFDYFGFALYGAYQAGALTVTGDLSYTQVDNDLEGSNEVGKLTASSDTSAWSLGVTGQYKFSFAAVDVTPHAGLRFTSLDLDDYSLEAAGYGNVANYDGDTLSVFSIPVGVTFAKTIEGESWNVTPALDLHVTGQFGDDEAEGTVAWSGTNLSTNVSSEIFDSFTYGATVGVQAESNSFSFGVGLGYTGSSNTDEFSAQANARFTF